MDSIITLPKQSTVKPQVFSAELLSWYDRHRRAMPWRALPDQQPDAYRVWLSEIMLQQTTVAAVIAYFIKFTDKWPDVHALAKADNDEVMSNWAGLGYYARARNLHKCAKVISEEYNGRFPDTYDDLVKLPGIGDYTASAITAIAFNKPANVVDGNVERVMARYYASKSPLPEGKRDLKEFAKVHAQYTHDRPGDYAQALMDLGATICTPKSPKCMLCPISNGCKAFSVGEQETYPIRSPKKAKPKRYGYVYWITNRAGKVLIHKRPEKGLLGGMYGLPTSEWVNKKQQMTHLDFFDEGVESLQLKEHVSHVFTHFDLSLYVNVIKNCEINTPDDYRWVGMKEMEDIGLPTVFSKAHSIIRAN